MENHALDQRNHTSRAEYAIRNEFLGKLLELSGSPLRLDNLSSGAPSLDFRFVDMSILGTGVARADPETVVGCGAVKQGNQACRPNMGQNIGCEYSRVCECLEYAPVDKRRWDDSYQKLLEAGETLGIPKRFPYATATANRPHRLINFYLNKRDTIYECNPRCNCGPDCKTRVVQKGRQLPLEIFKTDNRGWGKVVSFNMSNPS